MSNINKWRHYVPNLNTAEIVACYIIGALYLIMAVMVVVSDNETFITKNNNAEYIVLTTAVIIITYAFLREKNNV